MCNRQENVCLFSLQELWPQLTSWLLLYSSANKGQLISWAIEGLRWGALLEEKTMEALGFVLGLLFQG